MGNDLRTQIEARLLYLDSMIKEEGEEPMSKSSQEHLWSVLEKLNPKKRPSITVDSKMGYCLSWDNDEKCIDREKRAVINLRPKENGLVNYVILRASKKPESGLVYLDELPYVLEGLEVDYLLRQ